MQTAQTILEFDKIKERLCENALSQEARERLAALEPYGTLEKCAREMERVTQARALLDTYGAPPLPTMKGIKKVLALCGAGAMLTPDLLAKVGQFAASCQQVINYLKKARLLGTEVALYGNSMCDLAALRLEVERCIQNEQVESAASPTLRDLRRKMEAVRGQMQGKLQSLLRSKRQWFQDDAVVIRGGRYVLPVKREYRSQFGGTVVDISGSGGTCFMEPAAVTKLQAELSGLQVEEENEVRRVLYTLTALVDGCAGEIHRDMEALEALDMLFAKAKLSAQMEAAPPALTGRRYIRICQGRHPLLEKGRCVPLDFEVGERVRGVVITGPNTGGKTVALKTVGLLSMMAQSGLHTPAGPGSCFCLCSAFLCDVGDGQSISENLSTFSAHMSAMIRILGRADKESLVLLDELGSGTDPAEGMGLAVAILEELLGRGCLFLATTHYPQVREFAAAAQGMCNARMAFDEETLRPLYRLEMGMGGESCALHIAKRLGLQAHLLLRARAMAYPSGEGARPAAPAAPPAPPEGGEAREGSGAVAAPPAGGAGAAREAADGDGSQKAAAARFGLGDSVVVSPSGEAGIVFKPANSRGEVGVQVKGVKRFYSHKRLKLRVPASELYPEGYDFSVIFDDVSKRKARHKMGKGHQPGLEIPLDGPDWG